MDFSNMTFKDYNTKAAYDDKGSSAKGLVAAYKKENPNGSAEDFFSKLAPEWNTENVKKEIALAYPKAEEKKESAPIQNVSANTNINPKDAQFLDETTAINDKAVNEQMKKQDEMGENAHQKTKEEIMKLGENIKNIDDKMIDKLPRFVWDAYNSGEFGEPGSKDAKQRLAHFVMNDIGTSLKGISNLFMSMSGKSPIFSGDDLQSDYSKYKKTNLEEGMKNRWKKYQAETDAAIKMATDRGFNEEEMRNNLRKIQADKDTAVAWNMMNEKQKLYTLELYKEAGDKLSKLTPKERANFIWGAFTMGDSFTPAEAAVVLGSGIVEKLFDENGNINTAAATDALTDVIGGSGGEIVSAGLGALGGNSTEPGKGNTYNNELAIKGSAKDKVWGLGNINLSDQTLDRYFALPTKTPNGVKTALPGADAIRNTIKDYGKDSVYTVVSKSGIKKSIDNQLSEIDTLAKNATKEFKASGDLTAYQARMKELSDYKKDLESVYRTMGYKPLPGNSIDSDYDKAFGEKEKDFRSKYTKN